MGETASRPSPSPRLPPGAPSSPPRRRAPFRGQVPSVRNGGRSCWATSRQPSARRLRALPGLCHTQRPSIAEIRPARPREEAPETGFLQPLPRQEQELAPTLTRRGPRSRNGDAATNRDFSAALSVMNGLLIRRTPRLSVRVPVHVDPWLSSSKSAVPVPFPAQHPPPTDGESSTRRACVKAGAQVSGEGRPQCLL